ncbi:TetR/AcrR family transcriptional regulator [Cerasicoccus maritimus]|uniref:TetR/AcrR family transcriptional regulator n=1 Tax=Cerasicoccus maritimus TaxID=490089 RepID=UPI002852535E|nr:TetR/AcrR family transcriptional regulator [Cerasicoccus maritimus]
MKPGPDKSFDPDIALSAATAVFKAHGFEGASMSELTAAMGIGKKSLYDTFGNKRALFQQCVHAYAVENAANFRALLLESGSSRENLRKLLSKFVDMHADDCSHGCLLGSCMADFDANDANEVEFLKSALEQLENVFFDAFAQARSQGEISNQVDPRSAARLLICFTQGAALVGRTAVGREYLAQSYKQLEEILL